MSLQGGVQQAATKNYGYHAENGPSVELMFYVVYAPCTNGFIMFHDYVNCDLRFLSSKRTSMNSVHLPDRFHCVNRDPEFLKDLRWRGVPKRLDLVDDVLM